MELRIKNEIGVLYVICYICTVEYVIMGVLGKCNKMVIYFRMDQQLTIDIVEKHAAACKEQLSIESCDTNIKFYDQQKGKTAII